MKHLIENSNLPAGASIEVHTSQMGNVIPLRRSDTTAAVNAAAKNIGLIARGIDLVDFDHPISDIVILSDRSSAGSGPRATGRLDHCS